MALTSTLRTCKYGHQFYKSSDCPSCPICDKEKGSPKSFLALLSGPARNALLNRGIDNLEKLSNFTEKEILNLHGMGKASLPALTKALQVKGLSFKKKDIK